MYGKVHASYPMYLQESTIWLLDIQLMVTEILTFRVVSGKFCCLYHTHSSHAYSQIWNKYNIVNTYMHIIYLCEVPWVCSIKS